jgi:predicted Zn finger-like uncharacterized protein
MRAITHCPACHTQFFASEEQLNKHGGMVRCGQCLHIFDAKSQLVTVTTDSVEDVNNTSISFKDIMSPADASATNQQSPESEITQSAAETIPIKDINISPDLNIKQTNKANKSIDIAKQQPSYFDDAVKKTKLSSERFAINSQRWLWAFVCLVMVLLTCLSSIYFLRNEIAIYYPKLKPYLVSACQQISCRIELPKKIELIVIDDSDMQEDAEHSGLVRFSSKLINTGSYLLQYPNLELTLTDVDDKPVLRRIFKPNEYLVADTNITDGFKAGEEVTINLAITTSDISVAGYRVFVTY